MSWFDDLNKDSKKVPISTLKPGDWFMLNRDTPLKISSIDKIVDRPSPTGPQNGIEITGFDFHTDAPWKHLTPYPELDVPEEVKVTKYIVVRVRKACSLIC